MATTTVFLEKETTVNGSRFVARETVAAGDTLNVIGLPAGRAVNVKVYRGAGATISVYGSTDSEANIEAGTATKQLWPQGAVAADAEDVLESGHSGVIISTSGGTAGVEIAA